MGEITASLVKELREKTGAGMMDCKKALTETAGDLEEAVDWLRKKGLSAAAKKADRVAAEGLVGTAVEGAVGAMVEVNAETDFVSRNESFQDFVATVAKLCLASGGDLDKLKTAAYPGGEGSVEDRLTHQIATIGENMNLRRSTTLSVGQGVVASYVHNSVAPGLGRIGVLVGLESEGDKEKLADFGRQLAMHVAAANPQSLTVDEIDPVALERERNVLAEQARTSGKPEEIIEKMVEGRLRKYYQEVVLLEQAYVRDPDLKVSRAIGNAAKDIGSPVACTGFRRYALGEGVEREETDFAAEVAAQLAD
jgi:elongation factor Ts